MMDTPDTPQIPPAEIPPAEIPPEVIPPAEIPPAEIPPEVIPPDELPPDELPPLELPPAAQRALAEAAGRRKIAGDVALPVELGGRAGPEPVRYGDWENKGLAVDF